MTEIPRWIDTAALVAAREIEALPSEWPSPRRLAAIQVIVTRYLNRQTEQND